MKIIFILLFIINYVEAYSKKIVIGTYSNVQTANKTLKTIHKSSKFKEIIEFSDKHNIMLNIRPLGKYYILALEPFNDESILRQGVNLIKTHYKDIWVSDTNSEPKANIFKKSLKKEKTDIQKKENLKKTTIILEDKLTTMSPTQVIKQEQHSFWEYGLNNYAYFIMLALSLISFYYIQKLKRFLEI